MIVNESFSVTKDSSQLVQIGLVRSSKGLTVRLKTHRTIEEFFKTLSNETTTPVSLHGRGWRSPSTLLAYQWSPPSEQTSSHDYNMDKLGGDLILDRGMDRGSGNDLVNLSLLRLVGISSETGIVFTMTSLQSVEAVRATAKALHGAIKQFYLDYLKPFEVIVTMSVQEIK